jgi:hypothetical protein
VLGEEEAVLGSLYFETEEVVEGSHVLDSERALEPSDDILQQCRR